MPPFVTIITPSFNQGRFLRRTLDSVLEQSYPHIQYLIMDGGSTDDSVAILRSYGQRLHWVSEPDRGQAHGLNKGLALAQGDILAYLNSDDVLQSFAIEKVVNNFARHPDWDLLYGRALLIDECDRTLGHYRTQPFTLRRLAEDSCICQPACFWRRRLTERIGLFDEQLHFCMDYDYWLRAALAGARIGYVEDLLAAARLHAAAKTSRGQEAMCRESMALARRHLGRVSLGQYVGLWGLRWGGAAPWLARLNWWAAQLFRRHRGVPRVRKK